MQCRGPLSDEECRQDRWEISLGQEEDGEEEDGKHDTEASGGHWIAIDIGSTSSMVGLLVDWGVDYAHAYDVEVSHDSLSWTPVWSEAHGPADRNDVASMHTVHFIDLRKAGPGPGEVVRRNGVSARYVRLLIRRAEATVSLWRVLVFGFRDDARMLPHKSIHHLQLYLTDKGGNELGVRSKLIKLIIIDPRALCPFTYLVYAARYAPFPPSDQQAAHNVSAHCVLHLTTQEAHAAALFAPNASVAAARNALFERVRAQGINYAYLVFVDGDAVLEEVADYGFSSKAGAWVTLERYLLRWQPAVGFPHHVEALWDDSLEVQLVYNFNVVAAGVTAFHREAASALLPYATLLEHQSPWQAGVVQNAVASVLYNAHRLQFNALRVTRVRGGGAGEPVSGVRERHTEALAWLAPAILSIHAVSHVSWSDALASEPPCGGEAAVKNASYLMRPPAHAVQGWSGGGLAWHLDHCHPYFHGKLCAAPAASRIRCPRSTHVCPLTSLSTPARGSAPERAGVQAGSPGSVGAEGLRESADDGAGGAGDADEWEDGVGGERWGDEQELGGEGEEGHWEEGGGRWGVGNGPDVAQKEKGVGACDCSGCWSVLVSRMMALMQVCVCVCVCVYGPWCPS